MSDDEKYDQSSAAKDTGVTEKESAGAWHNARNDAAKDDDSRWHPGDRGVKKYANKKDKKK